MRCFIASFVPPQAWPALRRACPPIDGPRWLTPASYHVTFEFLGEIDATEVERQWARAAALASRFPIDCRVVSVVGFPKAGTARVVAALLESDGALEAVARACGAKRFRAHVTVGRCRRPMRVPATEVELGIRFESIGLYRSETLPEGARYTRIEPPFSRSPEGGR